MFPPFIVAVHAKTEEARACFERVLSEMNTSLSFQTPSSVILVLKSICEQLDADVGGIVCWRDVIREVNMELNILL